MVKLRQNYTTTLVKRGYEDMQNLTKASVLKVSQLAIVVPLIWCCQLHCIYKHCVQTHAEVCGHRAKGKEEIL